MSDAQKDWVIYHEVSQDSLKSVLSNGLLRTSRGIKSNDTAIIKTDHILDDHIPDRLKAVGLSRNNAIYGYLGSNTDVIDIENGSRNTLAQQVHANGQALLLLNIDPNRCYVSDLDTYDKLKNMIDSNASEEDIDTLARLYWQTILPLANYKDGKIRRAVVMITCDISPADIEVIATGSRSSQP